MITEDLRKLLDKSDDKLSMFNNEDELKKYNFNPYELIDFVNNFFSNEEKLKLFDCTYIKKLNGDLKVKIIESISDEDIILQILNNDNISKDIIRYQLMNIIKSMSDTAKQKILYNKEFIEKNKIADYELKDIIDSFTDEKKLQILADSNLVLEKLNLKDYQISELICNLPNENSKRKILEGYSFENNTLLDIICTFTNESKGKIILDENTFDIRDKNRILSSLDVESLINFFTNNKDFLEKNNIKPYEVISMLNTENQRELVSKIFDTKFDLDEKRKILVVLDQNVKESIDTTNLPKEYTSALNMQVKRNVYGKSNIILDLERDLGEYRGLDELISINPENFSKEDKFKFISLCDICPNMEVTNTLNNKNVKYCSTAKEYKEAENWIESLINSINPEYSKAQKLAIIDNAIGKKISYSPDFDTEISNSNDCRALWKIISSGYGVCNGIAKVEQYILDKIGIESEMIECKNHTFLKINNIELPLENGQIKKGATIVDPTWNLTNHRFGGRPDNFCISYEDIRKHDVKNGKDYFCHKNDEKLQDATLGLDDKSLRSLFTSVELAYKDGQFPIKRLLEDSKSINETYSEDLNENITHQFQLLSNACPEFATCQNSSIEILSNALLNKKNMKFNKCVINRVYNKEDKGKSPVIYVYMDSDNLGEKFYVSDKDNGGFIQLPYEEFTKQFECYEKDLEKSGRN